MPKVRVAVASLCLASVFASCTTTAARMPHTSRTGWSCEAATPAEVVAVERQKPPRYATYADGRRLVTRLILLTKDVYGDRDIEPMLDEALKELSASFSEVQAERAGDHLWSVRIGDRTHKVGLHDMTKLWQLSFVLNDVLDAVNAHYASRLTEPERAGIGIAAGRGMLRGVDVRAKLHLPDEWALLSPPAAFADPPPTDAWVCTDGVLLELPPPPKRRSNGR